MRLNTKTIAYIATFIAISIILTRMLGVTLPVGGALTLRLSFGEIPIILAGIMLGPLAGALTGIGADLLGYTINPFGGPYFPGFTFTAALTGMLPALILGRKGRVNLTWQKLFAAILITDIISSVILNTTWLVIMYNLGVYAILPARLLARALLIPCYTIIIHIIATNPVLSTVLGKQGASS